MAMQIRNTHELPTIRIEYLPHPKDSELRFSAYHGRDELMRETISAAAVGIREVLDVRAYERPAFNFPGELAGALSTALAQRTAAEDPRWLQVGPSPGHLAVVPWERLLQPALQAPLLRIPNFIADPGFLVGPPRLLVCVSAPWGAGAEEAYQYVDSLIQVALQCDADAVVDVFADATVIDSQVMRHAVLPHVHIHAHADGGDRKQRGYDEDWLDWMVASLGGATVDAAHFVCPGYFLRDQGALALGELGADASLRGTRGERAALAEADELVEFLNRIGAWITAFTPVSQESHTSGITGRSDSKWTIGVRLLADRLAWQRPGPILVHDPGAASYELADVVSGYQFLFARQPAAPPQSPSLLLYAHPKRVAKFAYEPASFESVKTYGSLAMENEELHEGFEDVLAGLSASVTSASQPADAWTASTRRIMDQLLQDTTRQGAASQRGTLEALRKVDAFLKGGQ